MDKHLTEFELMQLIGDVGRADRALHGILAPIGPRLKQVLAENRMLREQHAEREFMESQEIGG